jgi:hypothetical protein
MCELASALVVQRRHVGDLPAFGTAENGRVVTGLRHGMCELAFNAAEERHGNGTVCAN